MEDDFLAAFGR